MSGGARELAFADNARLANLCGALDANLSQIARALDVRIRRRGGAFRVEGDNAPAAARTLRRLYERAGGAIAPTDVQLSIAENLNGEAEAPPSETPVLRGGKLAKVRARTPGQRRYLETIAENEITLAAGPAGAGKTFLAVFAAACALLRGEVSRIVLVRPAIEAGERLGFLPGDLEQKVNPYLRPLYDALDELLGRRESARRAARGDIEIAPLAFMRGRTLADSFIILDEAQNTTPGQMKMLLTRLGAGSRIVAAGDDTQIDLPSGATSGLIDARARLTGVSGVGLARLSSADIVRQPVVSAVIGAYQDGIKKSPAQ
jgi:phosphate starvation-inducible PhoH-like protein